MWKKVDYESLGYKTYGEYFLTMYKEPFEEMFKYLFENEYDIAMNYFKTALNCTDNGGVIEKKVNGRALFIAYDKKGMQLVISLKGY